MQHHMIEKYIKQPLRWLLQKNVSYWHQGLHKFGYSKGNFQLTSCPAEQPGRIIIISRAHYQEFIQHYPVIRLHELKQVLKTEYQDNDNVLHFIGPLVEQRRAVCSFVLSESITTQFNRNCLIIPESLLLWRAVKTEKSAQPMVYQITAFADYFLNCAEAIPVSQRINRFCPDYASFMLNNGVSDLARLQQIPDTQYANYLVKALAKALPVFTRLALFRRSALSTKALPLKAMALSAAAVVAVYILGVAAYYHTAIDNRRAEIAALGGEVNQLLELQQQLQATDADAQNLLQWRADKTYSAQLWQLVITLLQQDPSLVLQNISSENGRIIIRGQANQATAVLTALQASTLLTDARFDASVRRQNNNDIFVISLLLAQHDATVQPAITPVAAVNSQNLSEQAEAGHAAK